MIVLDVLLQTVPVKESAGLWGLPWVEIGVLLSVGTFVIFAVVLAFQIVATRATTRATKVASQQLYRLRPVLDLPYPPQPAPNDTSTPPTP